MSSYNWRHRNTNNHRGGGSPLRSRKNLISPPNAPAPAPRAEDDVAWPSSPGENRQSGGGGGRNGHGNININGHSHSHSHGKGTKLNGNGYGHGQGDDHGNSTSEHTSVPVTPENPESPFDENKPTSPKTSAKNARNFWQQKASKSWKPPSSRERGGAGGGGGGGGSSASVTGSATGSNTGSTATGTISATGSNTAGGVGGGNSAVSSPSRSPSARSSTLSSVHSQRGPGSGSGSISGSSCGGNNINLIKSALFSGNMKKVSREREQPRRNLSPPVLIEEDDQDEHQGGGEVSNQDRGQSQSRGQQTHDNQDKTNVNSQGNGSGNGNGNGNGHNKHVTKSNRSWIKNLNSNRSRDRFVKINPDEGGGTNGNSTHSSPSQSSQAKTLSQGQGQVQPRPQEDQQQQQQKSTPHSPQTEHSRSSPKAQVSPRRQRRPSRYQQRQQQIQQHHQNYEQQQQQQQQHQQQHQYQYQYQKQPQQPQSPEVQDDGALGEMQIKLDIAAAKLLTEEMKQKDLTEQLEAAKSKHDQEVEAMLQEINSLRVKQDEHNKNMTKQSDEVQELYVEIERLHESQRAERNLRGDKNSDLEQERNEALERTQALEVQLEEMEKRMDAAEAEAAAAKAEASAVNAEAAGKNDQHEREEALVQELERRSVELKLTEKELRAVKKDINGITNDFRELADETERLEIELEAVTEDRDELLRRSVLYHNQAQSQAAGNGNTSVTIDSDGNEVPVPSSLNESSRQDYEIQQQQAELTRLRTSLEAAEERCRKKDEKIHDLEQAMEKGSKSTLDLDLSAIEVENMSYFTEDNKQEIFERFEEHIKSIQGEKSRLNSELNDARQELRSMEQERNNLKVCLADAMQELEDYENGRSPSCSPSPSPRKNPSELSNRSEGGEINDVFTQELIQIIREKDAEIENLTSEITKHHIRVDVSSDSFQEELNNVVEWLNSSTRINGSPSIEIMIRDKSHNVSLSPEDEEIVQTIHDTIQTKHYNFLLANARLKSTKKELQRQSEYDVNNYDTLSEASFERRSSEESKIDLRSIEVLAKREADVVVKELRAHVKACRDECTVKEATIVEIRKSLNDAANLIKPLKEHVTRIEHERANLQNELSMCNQRLEQLQNESKMTKDGLEMEPTQDQFGKMVQISPFELRKKDEEIIQLKIEVNQIRDELREVEADLSAAHRISKNRSFDEMPTPTKSNRSQLKGNSARQPTQSSGEEDDRQTRLMESEIARLSRDLKKKISAEETLKLILRDSSNRLTIMSSQAETLANEKSDAEYRILVLEKENVKLETQLKSVERQQSTSPQKTNQSSEDVEEYKQKLEEAKDRVDRVSIEAAELKAELKKTSRERKKMKKHLEEAVGMLNSLRSHVVTSEEERKKLKRHVRTLYEQQDLSLNSDGTSIVSKIMEDATHVPDPDHMENTTTILHLRSHIVKLEHEIRNLEDRIGELESSKPPPIDSADDPVAESQKIRDLEDKLSELDAAHQSTKDLLNEVSEINKEMLNDLKQTEAEAAETLEELDILKRKFNMARDEVDNAKYIAASAIRKLNNANQIDRSISNGIGGPGKGSNINFGNLENVPLTDCINQLEMRVYDILQGNRSNPSSSSKAPQDFW